MTVGGNMDTTELYREYYDQVVSLIISKFGDEELAADVAQETFVKIATASDAASYDAEKSHGRPFSWIVRIAMNVVYDTVKRKGVDLTGAVTDIDELPQHSTSPLDSAVGDAAASDLAARYSTLPDIFRVVYDCVVVDGMSYAEAAAYLDIPVNTVKTRLRRAKLHLGWEPNVIYSAIKAPTYKDDVPYASRRDRIRRCAAALESRGVANPLRVARLVYWRQPASLEGNPNLGEAPQPMVEITGRRTILVRGNPVKRTYKHRVPAFLDLVPESAWHWAPTLDKGPDYRNGPVKHIKVGEFDDD